MLGSPTPTPTFSGLQKDLTDAEVRLTAGLFAASKAHRLRADYEKIFADDDTWFSGHGKAYEAYGIDAKKGCIVIVRPDQYVALVCELEEYEKLGEFLSLLRSCFDVADHRGSQVLSSTDSWWNRSNVGLQWLYIRGLDARLWTHFALTTFARRRGILLRSTRCPSRIGLSQPLERRTCGPRVHGKRIYRPKRLPARLPLGGVSSSSSSTPILSTPLILTSCLTRSPYVRRRIL